MSDIYNMKEQMKEIFKTNGGKSFFCELNAARIPFFFVAAIENMEDKTEYFCEAITPGTMGIHLSEDKFADYLNIQNHGFIAVLDPNLISPGIQGKNPGGETGIKSSGSVLSTDKEPEADKSGGVTASGLLGLMIKSSL